MGGDPPQDLGWFARAHDLQEGEKANLVLGEDFHTNEVELLDLNDELLAVIESGGELVFKGGPDDEAVLCTECTTYAVKRVETSNTLLLFQPPGGLPDKIRLPDGTVDDADADASDDEKDRDGPTATPTPKRRKTTTEIDAGFKPPPAPAPGDDADGPPGTPAEAINRAVKDGVPLGEDGLKQITSFAQAGSHLEVTKIEPRLDPMWARLRSAPHAYAGPEREAEIVDDDAGADAGAEGEGADASVAHVLEMLVVTAQAKGMALDAVNEASVKSAMATDDPPTPEPVTQYVLRMYSEPAAGDGTRAIDAKKVCRSVASRMLEGSKPAAAGRLRLGEFLTAWRDGCNEELRAACTRDLLKGLALIEKGASGKEEEALVRVFRDVDLPKQPRDRFRALFALKPRWQMDELEHYIAATSDETIEAQLLKYTRVSQPTTDAVPIYSKR